MANVTNRSNDASVMSLTKTSVCSKNRAYAYQDESHDTNKGLAFFRAGICKDAIKNALRSNLRAFCVKNTKNSYDALKMYGTEVRNYMDLRYAEVGFKVLQQQKEQVLWDWRRVMRYLNSEVRVASFPEKATVMLCGKSYTVAPDLSFETDKDTIEYVFLKNGKPFSNSKYSKEQNLQMIQLFAGIIYGRQKGYKSIRSSFYFLRKTDDVSQWAYCSQTFGGSNVITLSDLYYGKPNELDDQMQALLDELANGVEGDSMCEKDCALCPNYDICKYNLPPVTTSEDTLTSEDVAMEDNSKEPPAIVYSDEQQAVIDSDEGIIRVIAAAGSGKTQTLAGRVAKLVEDGTDPSNILCITFSDAGVKEMRHKIERSIGPAAEQVQISTFHALEFDICKDNFADLGFKRNLVVIDEVQKYGIINELLQKNPIPEWQGKSFMNYGITTLSGTPGALKIVEDIFNQIKALDVDYSTLSATDVTFDFNYISTKAVEKVIKLYGKYDDICHNRGLINFDDMERLARKVIANNPGYLDSVFSFEHIIVDEFQDTSEGQMDFVKHLKMLKSCKSLMVVGDDAQSIYGFRGTSPDHIIHFETEVNEPCLDGTIVRSDAVKDITLSKNFRSKQEILDYASKILALNKNQIRKDIVAYREGNAVVDATGFIKLDSEYEWIADSILSDYKAGTKYEDIAVLAYTKNELRKIADALTKKGVPSMFGAPQPMVENSRIRAILAFARVIENKNDTKDAAICANALYKAEDTANDVPFMELPKAEIEARVNEIISLASRISDNLNPQKKKAMFIDYIEKIALGDEMVEKFSEQLENKMLDDILRYCRDFDDFGAGQQFRSLGEYPGVKLITVHSSKGLEWKHVYVTLNGFKGSRKENLEESRRLEFVAFTRARDVLHVSGLYYEQIGKLGEFHDNKILLEAFDEGGFNWDPAKAMANEMTKAKAKKPSKYRKKH